MPQARRELRYDYTNTAPELDPGHAGHGKLPAAVAGLGLRGFLAAGKLEDPFWRDNEDKALALMENDFLYTASFVPQAGCWTAPTGAAL